MERVQKDILDLMLEFEETGAVTHDCPKCGCECEPTEIDSDKAWCSECEMTVKVPRVI